MIDNSTSSQELLCCQEEEFKTRRSKKSELRGQKQIEMGTLVSLQVAHRFTSSRAAGTKLLKIEIVSTDDGSDVETDLFRAGFVFDS